MSRGISSWKRSLMELTKIKLGFFHRRGSFSRSGWRVKRKPLGK